MDINGLQSKSEYKLGGDESPKCVSVDLGQVAKVLPVASLLWIHIGYPPPLGCEEYHPVPGETYTESYFHRVFWL